MEIDAETFELFLNTDDYEVIWQGKPTRAMRLRGWTDALFNRLLKSCLDVCSAHPDHPLCSKLALWAGENSVDFAAHQKIVSKRRRKRETARLKVLKAHGYDGSALSEISARHKILKQEVAAILKLAESFMRVYSILLPDASYWLTGVFARSGFFHNDEPTWKKLGPGQRRFSKASLFITTSLGTKVKVTYQGVYLLHKWTLTLKNGTQSQRYRFKKLQLNKPQKVIAAFKKTGVPISGHEEALVCSAFYKVSSKSPKRTRRSKQRKTCIRRRQRHPHRKGRKRTVHRKL